jgi:hypothetical protein
MGCTQQSPDHPDWQFKHGTWSQVSRSRGENGMRAGALLFDEVEELNFVDPLEVFGEAARITGGYQCAIRTIIL